VVVRLLLDKDADVNTKSGRHGTALLAASSQGDKAVVRLQAAIAQTKSINYVSGDPAAAVDDAAHELHEEAANAETPAGCPAVMVRVLHRS
jgi:hypothetical protein